jgi:hypothetical protein
LVTPQYNPQQRKLPWECFVVTEFKADTRHYCRNPKCRMKLPAPVTNPREAFCTRGCHTSFYLHRCLSCEGPLDRKRESQKVCRKAKCRSAWQARSGFGRYAASSSAKLTSKTADSIDSKQPLKPDRAWRIIAGPPLTPSQFHCATVPDGPNNAWEGGEYRRIEDKNKAALKAAEQAEIKANGYFTEPEWREVTSPDGVKCFVTRFRRDKPKQRHATPLPIPDDLTILDFLDRRTPRQELADAA